MKLSSWWHWIFWEWVSNWSNVARVWTTISILVGRQELRGGLSCTAAISVLNDEAYPTVGYQQWILRWAAFSVSCLVKVFWSGQPLMPTSASIWERAFLHSHYNTTVAKCVVNFGILLHFDVGFGLTAWDGKLLNEKVRSMAKIDGIKTSDF